MNMHEETMKEKEIQIQNFLYVYPLFKQHLVCKVIPFIPPPSSPVCVVTRGPIDHMVQ